MITGAQCYTPRKSGSHVLQGVSIDVSADIFSVNISVAILVKCQSRLGRVVFTFGWVSVDNGLTDRLTRSCDSIGSVLAMYQWTVGWVLVRYRWSISWQSGLPVQLFSSCCHSHWFYLHPKHCEKFSLAFFTPQEVLVLVRTLIHWVKAMEPLKMKTGMIKVSCKGHLQFPFLIVNWFVTIQCSKWKDYNSLDFCTF